MNVARLYANENFPWPVVEQLRVLGHDVLTTWESGKSNQRMSDEEVLAFATFEGRAVLTLNRKHFRRLHELDARHAGIVICTYDAHFTEQAERIHQAISLITSLTGQLIRINRPDRSR